VGDAHRRIILGRELAMVAVGQRENSSSTGKRAGVLCLFFASVISSCTAPVQSTASGHAGQITLTVGLPVQTGQDPLHGAIQASRLVSREGLILPNRDGRAQPRLAESWTESPDGLTWTFKLRSNAVFHDGTPVDAPAVKASLERSLASADLYQYPGLGDIVGLETPNARELVIRLRDRSTFLLDDLGVSILKPKGQGSFIGAGPYVPETTSENELTMRAFTQYYRRTPEIERIVWKAYPTVRTAWAAMMRGEIDFLYEVGQETREFIEGESSVAVFPFLRNYVYAVGLNARKAVFKDARVRRALNHSVDRQSIVRQGFKGHARPESGGAWPQHWAFDPEVPTYVYDPQRASALLDAAGLPPPKSATSTQPPARLRFTCIFPAGFPLWEKIGLVVQKNFWTIGVDMRLETVSVQDFNSRIMSGDFDAVLTEIVVGNTASRPFTFWYSHSKQNVWGYHNSNVDAALLGIRHAASEAQYRNAFRDFQMEMLDDPPAVFLALGETSRAVSKRFTVITPPGTDILSTIADWQVAEAPMRVAN
jgi:peptide/nickel transport system substrate-binding protein